MTGKALGSFAKDVIRRAIFPIGAAFALVVLRSFSWWGYVVLGLLTLVAVAIAAVVLLTAGVMAAWRRDWRNIAVWGAVIIIAVPSLAATRTVTLPGDYVHLAVMYPFYALNTDYLAGQPFSVSWTNEGFLLTQGCDRSLHFDPTGKTIVENRRVIPDANSYYNWLSVNPLFMKFSVREDCVF